MPLRHRDEAGFTLLELMIVVLIIAGLLAIAIPTFLTARERANDRAAEARLRLAHTTAHTYLAEGSTFSNLANQPGTFLETLEPTVDFVDTRGADNLAVEPADHNQVTWWADNDEMVFVTKSRSGKVFYVYERTLQVRGDFDPSPSKPATPASAVADATGSPS